MKSFKRLEKALLQQLVTCRLNSSLEIIKTFNNQIMKNDFPRKSCFGNMIAYKKLKYK